LGLIPLGQLRITEQEADAETMNVILFRWIENIRWKGNIRRIENIRRKLQFPHCTQRQAARLLINIDLPSFFGREYGKTIGRDFNRKGLQWKVPIRTDVEEGEKS
jgi:hypothetical protein